MPKTYAVRRSIDADPRTVWRLLTDAPAYPSWNPAVLSLTGDIMAGQKIKLVSVIDPKRSFTLTVTELDEPRTMVWADGMPLGLFKGVRTYTLTPRDGGTDFAMEEVFSGPLSPLMTKVIPDMTDSFEMFADGLKAASESRVSGPS